MTYDRLYTVDEHRLINGVHNASDAMSFAPDCGDYASIQACSGCIEGGECDRPKGYVGWTFCRTHDGDDPYEYHASFQTLRFFYTCRVLHLAYRRTLERFPDWRDHEWVPFEPGWRKIEFTSPQRKDAEELCERLVREIADSGEVFVREQFTIERCDEFGPVASAEQSRTPDGTEHRHVLLVANVPEIDWQTNELFDDITLGRESFVPSSESFRFGYHDIAVFLAYLNPWLLSLANAADGRPPLTELDQELFDAVSRWDIERALRLIGQGANVNALDSEGETPLTKLGCDSRYYFEDPKERIPPLPETDKIDVMRRLLERGADINLFGYLGRTALCRAVNRRELEVVRFLLSHGSDPSHNHELFYAPNAVSTALGDSAPSDCADPNAPEERTLAGIRKTLINAGAVRRKGSPVTIVHVPHSSPVIPPAIRATLNLTDKELRHELLVMTDWFTDALFATPDGMAATITFPVSRLIVDPERFAEDDQELMAAKGMGAVYTKTSEVHALRQNLSDEERNRLLTAYYYPHQQRARDAVQAALADHGRCLLVDAHSFSSNPLPHEPDQAADRCQICIGSDDYHSPPWLVEWVTEMFQKRGFDVASNHPFSGTFIPIGFYRREPRALSVMIELNRSLYMDERTGERHAGFEHFRSQLEEVLYALSLDF
jgi:N-formylglutamate deformylase